MNKKNLKNNFYPDATTSLYLENKLFDNTVFQKTYYDYQFEQRNEKSKYGLVFENVEIHPKNSFLKVINGKNNVKLKVLCFVADAFENFKKYHLQFVNNNKINPDSTIYNKLEPLSAYKDLNDVYIEFIDYVYNIFAKNFIVNKIKEIKSFSDFIKFYSEFVSYINSGVVFSRSGFISNNLCPLEINGLVINFSDSLAYANSSQKQDFFINENFDLFFQNAKRFGFYVDRNAPWRIVADVESPVMIKYYNNYGIQSTKDLFEKAYHKAYLSDLETNKNVLIVFWNRFVKENKLTFTSKDVINCRQLLNSVSTIEQLSIENFDTNYNIDWQLRFLLFIKLNENNINVSQTSFENLHFQLMQINKFYGSDVAAKFINDKVLELEKMQETKKIDLTTSNVATKLAEFFRDSEKQQKIIF